MSGERIEKEAFSLSGYPAGTALACLLQAATISNRAPSLHVPLYDDLVPGMQGSLDSTRCSQPSLARLDGPARLGLRLLYVRALVAGVRLTTPLLFLGRNWPDMRPMAVFPYVPGGELTFDGGEEGPAF